MATKKKNKIVEAVKKVFDDDPTEEMPTDAGPADDEEIALSDPPAVVPAPPAMGYRGISGQSTKEPVGKLREQHLRREKNKKDA